MGIPCQGENTVTSLTYIIVIENINLYNRSFHTQSLLGQRPQL